MSREYRRGTVLARLGIGRDNYRLSLGLYGIGASDEQSPVMVTANDKLSFDVLRSHLEGLLILISNSNHKESGVTDKSRISLTAIAFIEN